MYNSTLIKINYTMKSLIFIAIALLALTSCQKEALVETTTTENTVKTKVAFSTMDSVKNFITGKWSWKGSINNGRGQTQTQTVPNNAGLQKVLVLNGETVTTFENGKQTASENYILKQTDNGWWFDGGGCSGILIRKGEQLVVMGSVVDRDDNYFDRAQ